MKSLIREYLAYKRPAWAESTYQSEAPRLWNLERFVMETPNETYRALKHAGYKPYTIKTAITRLNALFRWAKLQGKIKDNPYELWLEEHRYLFRNSYKNKQLDITFDEAKGLIKSNLPVGEVRDTAFFLLSSGIRISELRTVTCHGGRYFVTGKGNKKRRIYAEPPKKAACVTELRSALKKIGLTPHDLRRLFATHLLRKSVPVHDVAKATGHESIKTLMRYLQAEGEDLLQETINGVMGNG